MLKRILKNIIKIILFIFLFLFTISSENIYYKTIQNYYGIWFRLSIDSFERETLNYTKRNKIIKINQEYKFDEFYVQPEGKYLAFGLYFYENDIRKFKHNTKNIAQQIFNVVMDDKIKNSYKVISVDISVCQTEGNQRSCAQHDYRLNTETGQLSEEKSRYGESL